MTTDFDIDSLDTFTRAYMECALWASHDTDSTGKEFNLDSLDITDIAPVTRNRMIEDCIKFQKENERLLADAFYFNSDNFNNSLSVFNEQMGHDFWLTRNGHGAGFWDRELGQVGENLTTACKKYPDIDLYLGNDGKIYA